MIEPGNPVVLALILIVIAAIAAIAPRQRRAQRAFMDSIGATTRTHRRVNLLWVIVLLAAFFAPFVLLGISGGR